MNVQLKEIDESKFSFENTLFTSIVWVVFDYTHVPQIYS